MNKLILILLLFFISCKKETSTIKHETTKILNWSADNANEKSVKLNGIELTPPVNVRSGDVVHFMFKSSTLPGFAPLKVNITLDGVTIDGCTCTKFDKTILI